MDHVAQYIIAVFLDEDASDNSIDGRLEGLVNLRTRRKPTNEIYFKKLSRNDELQTLYQLGGGVGGAGLPRQIIVGRMGLIYYIGPMLSEQTLVKQISDHIRDTSVGIVNNKLFRVETRQIKP